MRRRNSIAILVGALVLALVISGCSRSAGKESGEEKGWFSFTKSEPIAVPAGTTLNVRLTTGLSSKNNTGGDTFEGILENALVVGDKVAIPEGTEVKGKVTHAVSSGRLKQRAELWVTLTEIEVNGDSYDLVTTTTGHKEGSKTKRNILFIGGGGGAGAAIGGATGGGKGAGIGAAIGAGAGTAAAMATGKRDISFPPETQLRFRLKEALKIQS